MEPGRKVGSYILEEPVGRGGMGVVYRGRHATLARKVAIKSINPRGRHDLRRMRHRFEREAFIQAQLDHPGIVKVYDYVVSEQAYFIVMEFVEGSSLAELISAHPKGLERERALDLFEQILEAISYAHTFTYQDSRGATRHGIVHRDLKPPNIMVAPDDRIKITDFGIVKLVGAEPTDTSNIAYGSPRYVSPEQADGSPLDQRSDIYTLGVILYEMLTGETPFAGRTDGASGGPSRSEILRAHRETEPRPPSQLNPEIPADVEKLILRSLEKKPERRFASAADFLSLLRRARGKSSAAAKAHAGETVAFANGSTGALGELTGELGRDPYHTQPITALNCGSCGAEVSSNDEACAGCGRSLNSSPATSELIGREGANGASRRPLFLSLAALLLVIVASLVYVGARRDSPPNAPQSAPSPAERKAEGVDAKGGASETEKDEGAAHLPVVKLDADVRVDSSYDGYNAAPLSDGVVDVRLIGKMRYNRGNWVSEESPGEHWIEMDFGGAARVASLYVYWGFDRDRYMPSRRVELRAAGEDGNWRTVAQLEPGNNYDRAAFEFEPFVANRLRVVQPPQQGPSNRPFVMWVREVQAFGSRAGERHGGGR